MEMLMNHVLNVPDDLLEWGRDVAVCRSWPRPWAHEATALVERGADVPLGPGDSRRLLGFLEALAYEAVAAGRGELLLELDTFTASQLGLRFEMARDEGPPLVLGGEGVSYTLAERLLEGDPQPDAAALAFLERCQGLLGVAFPRARISAMLQSDHVARCAGCQTECGIVSVAMESGSEYCGHCWTQLTEDTPPISRSSPRRMKRKR
jgi:hypothetical protein